VAERTNLKSNGLRFARPLCKKTTRRIRLVHAVPSASKNRMRNAIFGRWSDGATELDRLTELRSPPGWGLAKLS